METDGTTPSEVDNGERPDRRQRRWELWRQRRDLCRQRLTRVRGPLPGSLRQERPMWQEPLRGALYAAGGSAITLLTAWIQHWQ
ncbi:hypothetical protein [Streptomyces sp. CA2R101]|uniref:hypothetical protein n=1 Tax=Streptomyces sp. CA2R101 TaxID=3120152 RepID=UPI00300AE368